VHALFVRHKIISKKSGPHVSEKCMNPSLTKIAVLIAQTEIDAKNLQEATERTRRNLNLGSGQKTEAVHGDAE
jgi:hypothetical protein